MNELKLFWIELLKLQLDYYYYGFIRFGLENKFELNGKREREISFEKILSIKNDFGRYFLSTHACRRDSYDTPANHPE